MNLDLEIGINNDERKSNKLFIIKFNTMNIKIDCQYIMNERQINEENIILFKFN